MHKYSRLYILLLPFKQYDINDIILRRTYSLDAFCDYKKTLIDVQNHGFVNRA